MGRQEFENTRFPLSSAAVYDLMARAHVVIAAYHARVTANGFPFKHPQDADKILVDLDKAIFPNAEDVHVYK